MKTITYQTDSQCMAPNYTPIRNEEVNSLRGPIKCVTKMNFKTNTMRTKLLCIATLLLSITIFAQDLTVTFSNARNTNDGADDFYEADILVASNDGFILGDGLIYFNYNTAAFGENVVANGNFEFLTPNESILSQQIFGSDFYQTKFVDNTFEVVSTDYFTTFSSGTLDFAGFSGNNISSTPAVLFSIKIKYEDVSVDPGISFNTIIDGATNNFFTACGPFESGFNTEDCQAFPNTRITSENATFDSSGADINVLAVTSFDDVFVDFAVYPNPVQNSFTIASTDIQLDAIKLYNITGTLVKDISTNSVNNLIDVNHLQAGVYFLQVTSGASSKTIKILKN